MVKKSPRRSKYNPLSPRAQVFLTAMLEDPSLIPSKAALAAGYSKRNIQNVSINLLKHPIIAKAIKERNQFLTALSNVSAERILREVDILATSDIADVCDYDGEILTVKPFKEMNAEKRRAVKSVVVTEIHLKKGGTKRTLRVEMHNKNHALDLSAQIRGMKDVNRPDQRRPQQITLNIYGRDVPMPVGPDGGPVMDLPALPMPKEGNA